jgi:hypothetical protein
MSGDLTTSAVARQNILNNPFVLTEVEKAAGLRGIPFEGTHVVLKEQVAAFFEVTVRTIETHCADHAEELAESGYGVVRGARLKALKEAINASDVPEANFGNILKTPQLSIFPFRAFLNLAMVLGGSERARLLRQAILDVAIDTVNRRTGGATKYINQRDDEYLQALFAGETYRKEFIEALKECVDLGNFKYAIYTDKIYQTIFREKSREYRKLLRLEEADKTRSTFYAEVLDLVASFECGIADEIRKAFAAAGRKLTTAEVDTIFDTAADLPLYRPLLVSVRTKMASRDLALRGVQHHKLAGYISSLPKEEFERFLGEQSMELSKRLEEAKEVLKRLKDR